MFQTLNVRIISPKKTLFEGLASAVSSINSAGKFDILPSHANFITLIENQIVRIRKNTGEVVEFKFPLAIVFNQNNQVNIYTDIQSLGLGA